MTELARPLTLPLIIGAAFKTDLRARLIERLLAGFRHGRLTVELPDGRRMASHSDSLGVEADIRLLSWRPVLRLAARGDVGFAESYMAGEWETSDLVALFRLCADNAATLTDLTSGLLPARLLRLAAKFRRRNSRSGSRRNIMAHYDLGNDFFAEWLDPQMIYSSAIYADGDSLEAAQARKLTRIVELLGVEAGDEVLEIGCGWGALAARIAEAGAGHVTGLTLSPAQLEVARARMAGHPSAGKVELRLQDYRDVGGQYDRIASIEMFEAVGEAYWPTYFEVLRSRLRPGGRAVLQVISIDEARFDDYRQSPDMIQTMVFPGGMLPSRTALAAAIARGGLRLVHQECFGLSYAETLAEWRRRFVAAWPKIATMGYSDSFRRLWLYYLSYCEAGFRAGQIDVGLYVIEH